MAGSAEIIDLTTTPPPEIINLDSSSEEEGEILVTQPPEPNSSQPASTSGKTLRESPPRRVPLSERVGESSLANNRDEMPEDRGKRRRERDAKRDRDRPQERSRKRRRSSSPRRQRSRSPIQSSQDSLFFIDVAPVAVPPKLQLTSPTTTSKPIPPTAAAPPEKDLQKTKLLLPQHVTVFDGAPVEILAPPPMDLGSKSFIEYLDYDGDDHKGARRYFEDSADEVDVPVKYTCKQCKGDHRTSECTTIICLTCGVRNEHPTRRCPISKVCFRCKLTGHISSECTNKYSSSLADCDRCRSIRHQTKECPTIWRQYDYVTNEEQTSILAWRADRSEMPLGQGGEGYIADDEWCYNCGNAGHWGDDCTRKHTREWLEEPSAFGQYNTMSGPFADASSKSAGPSRRRLQRDWEDPTRIEGRLPANVGARGRKKEQMRMAKANRGGGDDGDDDQDWFSGARRQGERGGQRGAGGKSSGHKPPEAEEDANSKRKRRKRNKGSSADDGGIKDGSNPKESQASSRSLLDRMGGGSSSLLKGVYHEERARRDMDRDKNRRGGPQANQETSQTSQDTRGQDRQKNRDRDKGKARDWDREYERNRDRDRERPRYDSGPRYKGGYGGYRR
ncbi:hypothetical protein HGRIS_009973 [Hohenbuehelia grisea]|uniref:CCHC-type domain-containing protein n=1 Tax=Hohenbuehelia grisea TaxID=104357 RepID=A0ABR3J3A6_9AGAR